MPPKASKPPAPEKPKIPAIVWSPELVWTLISTAEAQENRNVMVGKLKEDMSSPLYIKYMLSLTFYLIEHDSCQYSVMGAHGLSNVTSCKSCSSTLTVPNDDQQISRPISC